MDTPVVALLALLIAAFGLVGCFLFCVMFAHELAERLVASRAYTWLLPVATAVLAGIGTALIAAALEVGGPWYGLVPAAGALAGAGWSALVLRRRGRNGGRWLSRTRSRLQHYLDPQYRPADPAEQAHAMTQTRRIEQTGAWLTGRANRLTIRHWAARPARADLVTAVMWLFTSAVMGLITLVMFMGVTTPSIADLAAMAILGLSFLAGPAGMLLRHENRRRRLHQIGTQLIHDARRATATLTTQLS